MEDIVLRFGLDSLIVDFIQKILLSLMIGILIGLERERQRSDSKIFAGVRTFTLTCILGMLSAFLIEYAGISILLITTIFIGVTCIFLAYNINRVHGSLGLTTSISLFCTYLLGVLIAADLFIVAIVTAVIITFLLIEKKPLHSLAENLSERDIIDALQFIAIAFILYPVVPDEPIFGIISLKSTMLIIVLISSISFVSYVLLKKIGARGGIAYSGFLGGLASSGAAVISLSNLSRKRTSLTGHICTGALLTIVSMIIRDIIFAFLVDTSGKMALLMIPPFLVMSVVTLLIVLRRRHLTTVNETIELRSPFAILPALQFGILFMIITLVADIAQSHGGSVGIYATAIGGIVSSSAVTVSMASLALNGTISYHQAAQIAVSAGLISTLAKPLYMKLIGANQLYRKVTIHFVIITVLGAVSLLIWSGYAASMYS
jgi:uncharacterized membrane protein (DUF4010 family)